MVKNIKNSNKTSVKQNVNVKVNIEGHKKKNNKKKVNRKRKPTGGVSTHNPSYLQPFNPVYIQSGNAPHLESPPPQTTPINHFTGTNPLTKPVTVTESTQTSASSPMDGIVRQHYENMKRAETKRNAEQQEAFNQYNINPLHSSVNPLSTPPRAGGGAGLFHTPRDIIPAPSAPNRPRLRIVGDTTTNALIERTQSAIKASNDINELLSKKKKSSNATSSIFANAPRLNFDSSDSSIDEEYSKPVRGRKKGSKNQPKK